LKDGGRKRVAGTPVSQPVLKGLKHPSSIVVNSA
jgi:hypothetical protein